MRRVASRRSKTASRDRDASGTASLTRSATRFIERALDESELSPREVAVAFTDAEKTFVSEASVYRILKAEGLVTSPAFIVMNAADRFANPTTAINQLWQTDFTYLKVTGW
jgi:putative transposase